MSNTPRSLTDLAPSVNYTTRSNFIRDIEDDREPINQVACENKARVYQGNLLSLILWFIIIAIIVAIVLSLWKPVMVQTRDANGNATGDLDGAKVIISSLIISLIIVIIIYLIRTVGRRHI